MRVTIVRPDNSVVVDDVFYKVDCTGLPGYIKAVQWNDEIEKPEKGYVEFMQDHNGKFMKNHPLVDFSDYTYLVEAWQRAKEAADALKAADAVAKTAGPDALAHLRK